MEGPTADYAAFALIYLTFFLDNVLLTVLVPIIPDWVRGGAALEQWAKHDAPLAALLNSTVHEAATQNTEGGIGRAQATVGVVLGSKAVVQLAAAGPAALAVCRLGPASVLRAATLLLALASIVFWACSVVGGGAVAVAVGRGVHGAAAALGAVAGLALAAALPEGMLSALLGAVALGVLVGYPFGGAASSLWKPGTPFLLLAAAFLINLALQYKFLDKQKYNMPAACFNESSRFGFASLLECARGGCTGWCAGSVLLSTSVMAALEPLLPLWLEERFQVPRWQTGIAFVPDSSGYLLAASTLGGYARRVGAERVALTGQVLVGSAALFLPVAWSPWALIVPQFLLGGGLGAVDAALVPALLARVSPRRAAARAALLQAASSSAYAVGPVCGGAVSWAAGGGAALRALGVVNLLYVLALRHQLQREPLSEQWGASPEPESDDEAEMAPLQYAPLR